MLRLTTFGGVVLRQDGVAHEGAASQRRRLALLTLIATAGSGSISRDKLLAYLWPEGDTDNARHALRQSLHGIQRALSTDGLFVGSELLQLDPTVISSDVVEFEQAIEARAPHRAVALYKGPFLDGFFISGANEFDRWAERLRVRYAGDFIAALDSCATEATERGEHAAAVVWWRRLAAELPLSSRYALGAMRALSASGDNTGALHFAQMHEAAVREELGVEPDVAIRELAERLRATDKHGAADNKSASARSASAAAIVTSRSNASNRKRELVERALGDRFVIDAGPPSGLAYSAYDRQQKRAVLIQLLDPGICAIADVAVLIGHFDRIAQLRHPCLVPLYEYGQAEGVLFLVTGRGEGVSLREKSQRDGTLPVAVAVSIADDVAAALETAHAAGIHHGDLRPRHILVNELGTTLSGIGIAEALTAATAHDATSSALRVGSPAYQSPELISGAGLPDARSDLYSLGCILYEMLAGEVPFTSPTPGNIVSGKLTSAAPSVAARRNTVSGELDALVQRCLARSPADRFSSATELRAALKKHLAN